MAAQLPPGVASFAAGILVYSFFCFSFGPLLLYLTWAHNERFSYIAMLTFFVSLHTVASIMQQIHTIVAFKDVKTKEWENIAANVGSPELNITGGATGLDRVLFYIQYYSYNVESLLVFFWAVALANSIFQLRIIKTYRFHASMAAKTMGALFPAGQMIILRFCGPYVNTAGYMVIADGIIPSDAILVRYIHSRINFAPWNVGYGQPSGSTGQISGTGASGTNNSRAVRSRRRRTTIYDKWLVLRFTIAFLSLSLFQIIVVNFQLRAASHNNVANLPPEPDLSPERAKGDFALFAPAVSAPPLVFIVFGTTRTFRKYMWAHFVPAIIRNPIDARRQAKKLAKQRAQGYAEGSVSGTNPCATAATTATGGSVTVENSAGITYGKGMPSASWKDHDPMAQMESGRAGIGFNGGSHGRKTSHGGSTRGLHRSSSADYGGKRGYGGVGYGNGYGRGGYGQYGDEGYRLQNLSPAARWRERDDWPERPPPVPPKDFP